MHGGMEEAAMVIYYLFFGGFFSLQDLRRWKSVLLIRCSVGRLFGAEVDYFFIE